MDGTEIPDKRYFRIGEVARIVGVATHVLRFWEQEFRALRPQKSASGQRVYARRDVERLLLIKRLLKEERYTIEGARKALRERGEDDDAPDTQARPERLREALVNTRDRLTSLLATLDAAEAPAARPHAAAAVTRAVDELTGETEASSG